MQWFVENTHWAWMIAGVVLVILEIFGAGGYLIVAGITAVILALVTYFFPELGFKWQLAFLGLTLVVNAVLLTRWFRKYDKTSQSIDVGKPGGDLIGRTVVLQNDIVNHESKIRLQDANWDVSCREEAIASGGRVQISDVKGRTLIVTPV